MQVARAIPILLSLWASACERPLDLGKLGPLVEQPPPLDDPDANALEPTTITNLRSGKVVDVTDASISNNAGTVQHPADGSDSQLWRFLWAEANIYYIVNVHSGKCLDIPSWSAKSGVQAIQYTCRGGNSQQWEAHPICRDTHTYFELRNRNSQLVLDVFGGSLADDAQIIQWPYKGDADSGVSPADAGGTRLDNQLWFMTGPQWSDCPDISR
jgi:Ricin-type beta-trefoil lectin domain-like